MCQKDGYLQSWAGGYERSWAWGFSLTVDMHVTVCLDQCSRGTLRWRLKSLCQTTRTGSLTVSLTPSSTLFLYFIFAFFFIFDLQNQCYLITPIHTFFIKASVFFFKDISIFDDFIIPPPDIIWVTTRLSNVHTRAVVRWFYPTCGFVVWYHWPEPDEDFTLRRLGEGRGYSWTYKYVVMGTWSGRSWVVMMTH